MWSSANPCQTYPCIWSRKRTQTTRQNPFIVICFYLVTLYLAHLRKSPASQRSLLMLFRRRPTQTHQLTALLMKMMNRQWNSRRSPEILFPKRSPDILFPKRGLHHVNQDQESKLLLANQLHHLVGQKHGKRNLNHQ